MKLDFYEQKLLEKTLHCNKPLHKGRVETYAEAAKIFKELGA